LGEDIPGCPVSKIEKCAIKGYDSDEGKGFGVYLYYFIQNC
jgi:hypothetical protein